jgi:aspartate 1-decarboxylase
MLLTMMKGKIHGALVTETLLHYEGSIGIDKNWLQASGILPNEKVDVYNVNTGARFQTYAIEAPTGSKTISLNGAAARLAQVDDKLIIVAFALLDEVEAQLIKPKIVFLNSEKEH